MLGEIRDILAPIELDLHHFFVATENVRINLESPLPTRSKRYGARHRQGSTQLR